MQILLTLWRVRQEGRGLDAKTACTQLGRGGQAGAVMQILLALNWAGAVKPYPPLGGEAGWQGQSGGVMQILLALNWAGAVKPHPFEGVRPEGRGSKTKTACT